MSETDFDDKLDRLPVSADVTADIGTEFRLQIDGVEPRLTSKLIGVSPGNYLIVTTPTLGRLGGLSVKLFPGNRVIVRYIHRDAVYGFETSIIEAISSPFMLLFLKAPREIVDRNIRSNERVSTALPARVSAGETSLEGTITDISISGCHFESRIGEVSVAGLDTVGAKVWVALQLPEVSGEIQAGATLRNVHKSAASIQLGIAFSELEEGDQLSIDEYVKKSN